MNKIESKIYPHLYPKPIVLIGALVEGKPNFFTMADLTTSGYQKSRIILSSGKIHHTNEGIIKNKTFSVNIPSVSHIEKTDYCGMVSGAKEDKSRVFEVFYGNQIDTAPLIIEFPINHACKLVKTIDFGDTHYIFIGEIIETYVTEECLGKRKVDIENLAPISYCTVDNQYRGLGAVIGRGYNVGRSLKTS